VRHSTFHCMGNSAQSAMSQTLPSSPYNAHATVKRCTVDADVYRLSSDVHVIRQRQPSNHLRDAGRDLGTCVSPRFARRHPRCRRAVRECSGGPNEWAPLDALEASSHSATDDDCAGTLRMGNATNAAHRHFVSVRQRPLMSLLVTTPAWISTVG
jgi:hypothetical protein